MTTQDGEVVDFKRIKHVNVSIIDGWSSSDMEVSGLRDVGYGGKEVYTIILIILHLFQMTVLLENTLTRQKWQNVVFILRIFAWSSVFVPMPQVQMPNSLEYQPVECAIVVNADRKSTRLNSSHL